MEADSESCLYGFCLLFGIFSFFYLADNIFQILWRNLVFLRKERHHLAERVLEVVVYEAAHKVRFVFSLRYLRRKMIDRTLLFRFYIAFTLQVVHYRSHCCVGWLRFFQLLQHLFCCATAKTPYMQHNFFFLFRQLFHIRIWFICFCCKLTIIS